MTAFLALLIAAPSGATTPDQTAVDWLREATSASLEGDHEVRAAHVLPWAAGTKVRLQHVIHGIGVEGRDVVVDLDLQGNVRRARGPLQLSGDLDPVPTVSAVRAVIEAEQVASWFGQGSAWEPRTELVAWLDGSDRPHLAWGVDVATMSPFTQWRVLVDAHDGEVLWTRPTSFHAQGNVYPSNPVESSLTEVTLPGLLSDTELSGEYGYVVSCDDWDTGGSLFGGGTCLASSPHAVPDVNGDYLFSDDPLSEDDPLAEVQMYYHLDLVSAWFEEQVGFRHSQPIQGVVNFPMTNAFYGDADGDGRGDIAFGQGGGVDFAYDADVIYHEFVHSVVGQVTSLGFFGADEYGVTFSPVALNEGSADLFSLLLTDDPSLGAYAGSGVFGEGAIRDLEADRTCPEDLYGESHKDGEIWGAMGWNIIEDPAVSAEQAMQLFYGTTISWTDPSLKYADAGQSMLDTASDLLDAGVLDQAAYDAIVGHVEASGLPGCVRVIPLDDGTKPTLFAQYIGLADLVGHIPLTAQFSLEVPEGATSLEFKIRDWSTTADMGWTVFVRRGDNVHHDVQGVAGFEIPVVTDYDFSIDGTGKGTITIPDPDLGIELEPGAPYYFSIATRNLGGISGMELAAGEVTVVGSVECCTDAVADADEKKGCGCQTTDAGGSSAALLLLLALIRRRE